MTTTTNTTPTDVHDMVVVHRAFRREFTMIPRLVREVAAGDTARAALVTKHARLMLDGLHLHHTSEDELLWPKLLDRCPPDAALVLRMEEQHERVEHHTERLRVALDRWQVEARPAVTEEVASTFDALGEALLEHLGEEEREILPLAAQHVSQAEWNEIGQHGIAKMSKAQLPLLFGLILEEATAEEAADMYASVPPPIRLLTRLVFLPKYRRYIAKVRSTAAYGPGGGAAMTTPRPLATATTSYSTQASGILLAAFTASAGYTVYTTVAGLPADGFSATDPAAWAYYAIGFGAAVAVRSDRRAAWWTLAVLLPVLLAVSVLVYPASFVPALQTPLGWLENDGYVALLSVALYLTVQRLRRVSLTV